MLIVNGNAGDVAGQQIGRELDPFEDTTHRARQALRGWGINIPLEINPILPALKDLANTDLSDKDIQALLDKVQNSWQVSQIRTYAL